jgi:hypothetical protein
MGAHQVSAVLVDDREEDVWRPLLATLGVMPVRAGGITLYRMSPAELAPWKNSTALEMETRASRARFAALVLGTEALMRRPIRPNSGRRAESSPAAGGMGYGPAEAPAAVRGRRA